jgi:hypothetical protein
MVRHSGSSSWCASDHPAHGGAAFCHNMVNVSVACPIFNLCSVHRWYCIHCSCSIVWRCIMFSVHRGRTIYAHMSCHTVHFAVVCAEGGMCGAGTMQLASKCKCAQSAYLMPTLRSQAGRQACMPCKQLGSFVHMIRHSVRQTANVMRTHEKQDSLRLR